jgi:hypothetical protein
LLPLVEVGLTLLVGVVPLAGGTVGVDELPVVLPPQAATSKLSSAKSTHIPKIFRIKIELFLIEK